MGYEKGATLDCTWATGSVNRVETERHPLLSGEMRLHSPRGGHEGIGEEFSKNSRALKAEDRFGGPVKFKDMTLGIHRYNGLGCGIQDGHLPGLADAQLPLPLGCLLGHAPCPEGRAYPKGFPTGSNR